MKNLFIFRRDLRTIDNTALIEASKTGKTKMVFFLDPRQILNNPYKSEKAISFMLESIEDINVDVIKGKPEEEIFKIKEIDAVYVNRDYTPFSIMRDHEIKKSCEKIGINFFQFDDYLLTDLNKLRKPDGGFYKKFTPFFDMASKIMVKEPNNKVLNLENKNYRFETKLSLRSKGIEILKNLDKFRDYGKLKDIPSFNTTKLSAHLKFGTISIREAYWAIVKTLGANHPLIRQLYWRDFFTYVAYHYPHVFGKSFNKKFDNIKWDNTNFDNWCKGKTGFPIVDAGMKELNSTGFMHNRVRMICASFLIKDLHVDWKLGEKYFASKLVDYDPSVNNGNWQWTASTGCDSQPYFRIFNPWLQQKKFDPHCNYIKKWIVELENIEPYIIHDQKKISEFYIKQIIDHKVETNKTKAIYASLGKAF